MLHLASRKAAPTRCAAQHATYTVYHVPAPARAPALPRQPQDLAIVLDISASMAGPAKLERVKRAIAPVVRDLREGDLLTLVTVGSSASVRFERMGAGKRKEILALLQALQPTASRGAASEATDLDAGLEAAQLSLEAGAGGGAPRTLLQRIFLFSDGLTTGDCEQHAALLQRVEELQRRGVLTSAFAPGAECDRSLMIAIAQAGRGHFASLDIPESVDAVRAAAADTIRPFATEAQLFLTPMRGALELRAHGHRRRRAPGRPEAAGIGATEAVPLGALRFFGTAELLVEVRLPALLSGMTFAAYELALRPWGAAGPVSTLTGFANITTVRRGRQAAPPHHGVRILRELLSLTLRDDGSSWAAGEDVKQRLDRLAADAMRVEQADPSLRSLGLVARVLAVRERLQ